MAVQIFSKKDVTRRAKAIGGAIGALGALLNLKEIKTKIEKGKATAAEKRNYSRNKSRLWRYAATQHRNAAEVFSNGTGKKKRKRG